MKLLAISIPNYNRVNELKRLISEVLCQIKKYELYEDVQVCISDDGSMEDPSEIVNYFIKENADIEIKYIRKTKNQGMDYNFKDSVLMADAQYCWIIGNDDIPNEGGVKAVIDFLNENEDVDFLVTPFDIFDENGGFRSTLYPLKLKNEKRFDTRSSEQRQELFNSIQHNSGIFGFLSNVVFRREAWEKNKDNFKDKMNSIFIQMYMNIDTLIKGAVYYYLPVHIIRNVADDDTNNAPFRIARILDGLDGVTEYFFTGYEKDYFKKILTDAYVSGIAWEISDELDIKNRIINIESPKNNLYRQYYIQLKDLKHFFDDKTVVVYGAGEYGRIAINRLITANVKILGVADSNEKKVGKYFEGYEIMRVIDMLKYSLEEQCYIVPASYFGLCDMVDLLKENGVKRIAIVC